MDNDDTMHLREYLSKRGDLSDLAHKLGLEPTTVRRWKMGRTPSLKLCAAIEEATSGAVPISSWLTHPASKRGRPTAKAQRSTRGSNLPRKS